MNKAIIGLLALGLGTSAAAKDSEDLKRDMKALELYLQDKSDYKNYCPKMNWDQPKLSVYKKKLKSLLPKKCKKK